ncbi:MAG: hypothetical protein HQK49_01830 [Oligoflexia bacterium]|nr:hypothetical protein [Oligoflexia bacterium]
MNKNSSIIISAICIIFFIPLAVFAANPLKDKFAFSDEHSKELLKVCFGSDLDCGLLSCNINGKIKTVTLVGEAHDQKKSIQQLGNGLLKHYKLVGHEPSQTSHPDNYFDTPILSKIIDVSERTFPNLNFLTNECEYSMLNTSNLQSILPKNASIVNLEKGNLSSINVNQLAKTAESLIYAISFIGIGYCASSLLHHETPGFNTADYILKAVIITSTFYKLIQGMYHMTKFYFESKKEDKENSMGMNSKEHVDKLKIRDKVMSENIYTSLENFNEKDMVAVTGAFHLYGIKHHLIKNHGCKDHARDLMKEYQAYNKEKIQDRFPQDHFLVNTSFHNLYDPFFSNFVNVKEKEQELKTMYPDDYLENLMKNLSSFDI